MFRVRHMGMIGAWTLALAGVGWAQSVISIEAQFAGYHQALSVTADSLITAPASAQQDARPESAPVLSTAKTDNTDFTVALGRVQQLRPLLEPILREQGLPTDVAAIVLVESGGRPTALSPKGARGLWQLMPDTARRYGLDVSAEKDERTDLAKATRAAARYLRDLYAQFGDWQLAFAAYNAGEQTVQRAMTRTGSNEFQRLNLFLPRETRAYVPAVLAARVLFGRSHDRNVTTLQAARRAHVLYASARLDN